MTLEDAIIHQQTAEIAEAFLEIQGVFFSACRDGLRLIKVPGETLPPVVDLPTKDGEFLMASFQMWVLFDLLDMKRELYVPPASCQRFVDLIYPKLMGDAIADSDIEVGAAAEGVLHFDRLAVESNTEPHKDFLNKIRACLFGRSCSVTGYRTSGAELGLRGFALGIPVDNWISAMTDYLVLASRRAVAICFNDHAYANELEAELDDLKSTI